MFTAKVKDEEAAPGGHLEEGDRLIGHQEGRSPTDPGAGLPPGGKRGKGWGWRFL